MNVGAGANVGLGSGERAFVGVRKYEDVVRLRSRRRRRWTLTRGNRGVASKYQRSSSARSLHHPWSACCRYSGTTTPGAATNRWAHGRIAVAARAGGSALIRRVQLLLEHLEIAETRRRTAVAHIWAASRTVWSRDRTARNAGAMGRSRTASRARAGAGAAATLIHLHIYL